MKSHIAEYVSPGHPDRLADAIVESIVDLAVGRDGEALVGVECAVHTDHVFIDGRIAAGRARPPDAPPAACAVSNEEIEEIARNVYREAGYGGIWIHAPEKLKVIQNVCLEPLSDDERAIRSLSATTLRRTICRPRTSLPTTSAGRWTAGGGRCPTSSGPISRCLYTSTTTVGVMNGGGSRSASSTGRACSQRNSTSWSCPS